ncbi:KTSC domain-containing protein [Amycolatopsis sp.]|uniref:KTSC domain-containing protein n=1 Tax=Amycolatopsis sp. TaxID=37632 RepID=UPI00345B0C74
MQRHPVRSSNLRDVGYDASINLLEIGFKSGSVYQYLNVPQGRYDGLMATSSHGGYFAAYIKPHYPARRVG